MSESDVSSSPYNFPLALRPCASRAHAPAAWWIPGESAEGWLDEIAAWGVAMEAVTLYVLPRSLVDRGAAGVLAVPPTGGTPAASARAQAYGRVADKLYLPADAVLAPGISDEEWARAVAWDVAVLHPSIGLVGFARADALRVDDLLALPERHDAPWDAAVAGVSTGPRLTSVEPDVRPTIELIVEDLQDDIGTAPPQEAPSSPDESTLGNAAAAMGLTLSNLFKKLHDEKKKPAKSPAPQKPGLPAGKGAVSKLRKWFNARRTRVTAALQRAREREIRRLMALLESDPDQGLRFAIPLAGVGRGLADPTGLLGPRDVEFNLGALGGGRPADPWNLSTAARQRLMTQYRDAATREMQLGRHRRAAYIFARLLGDDAAAANALKQGRHYREAAVLYRDRLNNSPAAASCLEDGGLLTEAIEIYRSLRQFEKCGDLYARIERPIEAMECYGWAVAQCLEKDDRLRAAELLATKMASEAEAMDVLLGGWPDSAQPAACLHAYFQLLGRTGGHVAAASRVAALVGAAPSDMVVPLAETLGKVAASYPNPTVRGRAADATRVLCGQRLREAGAVESASLVNVVVRLEAQDRLLARDGSRFMAARLASAKKPPPTPRPAARPPGPKLLHSFYLGTDVDWKRAIAHDGQFYATGVRDGHSVFLRGQWDGTLERAEATDTYYQPRSLWMEMLPERNLLATNLRRRNQVPLQLPATARSSPLAIGLPDFLPGGGTLCVARDEHGVAWALQRVGDDDRSNLVLNAFSIRAGGILSTRETGASLGDGASPCIVAGGGHVVLGLGHRVIHYPSSSPSFAPPRVINAASPMALSMTFPMTQARVVWTYAEGGAVYWPDAGEVVPIGDGLFDPRATFTYTGELILAGRQEGRVYRMTGEHAVLRQSSFETRSSTAPLAVLPASRLSEFAVISMEGMVRVFSARD